MFSANDGSELFSEKMRLYKNGRLNISTPSSSSIWFESSGDYIEPTIRPSSDNWGYLGTSTYFWYRMYANDYYYTGGSSWYSFDTYNDLQLLNDIKMDFYWDKKLEHHVGVIQPESIPKCITNYEEEDVENLFVNAKKVDGLLIGSMRQLDYEAKRRDEILATAMNVQVKNQKVQVSTFDMGSINNVSTNEIYVPFNQDFVAKLKGAQPMVQITPSANYNKFYVKEKTANGFVLYVEADQAFSFDWNASANITIDESTAKESKNVDAIFGVSNWGKIDKSKIYPDIESIKTK